MRFFFVSINGVSASDRKGSHQAVKALQKRLRRLRGRASCSSRASLPQTGKEEYSEVINQGSSETPVSVCHPLERERRHKGRIERLRVHPAYRFEACTLHQQSSSWQKEKEEGLK